MDKFYRTAGVNPGRSGYDVCIMAGEILLETRKLMTAFFNGPAGTPERCVFGYNSTDALNLAIFGMLKAGDHAITTAVEHNSVLRPFYHLAEFNGVAIDIVPFDGRGFVDPDEIKRRFRPNTRLVAVNHGSNVIGTVQPVGAIGRRCREAGIPFLIDASQTAGKVPVNMKEQCIDVVCFTGHKSLMGPMGIGGMVVGEGVEIRFTRAGGTGVKSAQKLHLEEYPYRMEYGTPNMSGIAGLNAGVKWVNAKGLDGLYRHEMHLTTMLRDGLKAVDGVTLYCQDDLTDHIAVLLFNIDGLEPADAGTMLDVDHNIACRTGLHCAPLVHERLGTDKLHGAVRFGIGPFNTEAHIRTAIAAVAEIAADRRKR
jgi:cysteine desulfurase family protein